MTLEFKAWVADHLLETLSDQYKQDLFRSLKFHPECAESYVQNNLALWEQVWLGAETRRGISSNVSTDAKILVKFFQEDFADELAKITE